MKKVKKKARRAYLAVRNHVDKLAAKALGVITVSMGTSIAASASSSNSNTTTAWESIVSWINNNASNLKTVAYALIGLCLVAAAICMAIGGTQGMGKVKNWLIGLCVAVLILVFGASLLSSLYTTS